MRRVDPEVDGQIGDALVGAGDTIRLVLDLLHDGGKVHELFALAVEELAIFVGRVDQLKDERSSGHDSGASRQKVPRKRYAKNNSLITQT